MDHKVFMKSPAGEIKEVSADEKTLVPLMAAGWTQHVPAAAQQPEPPAAPAEEK